jgi:outer membrane protein assembly factor BamB
MAIRGYLMLVCAAVLFFGCSTPTRQQPVPQTNVSVLTHHNDNARTGANLQETLLNVSNVNKAQFGKLFERSVDGDIYGQPLYVPNVETLGEGRRNLVYVTTMHNSVYAFDADQKDHGRPIWVRRFGSSVPTSLFCDGARRDIRNEIGIVSTPVISISRHALYLVSFTLENGERRHYIHALDLGTGIEALNGPKRIEAEGFAGRIQNQRPGLLLANDTVYVGFGAYADCGPFHGWVFGFNADTLEMLPRPFNANPLTVAGSGIWQAGQAPAADEYGNVYVVVGNGTSKDILPPLPNLADKVSFNEQVMGHPAAIDIGGRLLIAWMADRYLKIATWRPGSNEKSLAYLQKPSYGGLNSPALAFGNRRAFLAWAANEGQSGNHILVLSSTDFKVWIGDKFPIPDSTSLYGPALAFGNGRLFVAWTDQSKNVTVRSSADGIHWSDSDKVTLPGPSAAAPQLAFIDDSLFLLWTDGNHIVNLMQSNDGKSFSLVSKKWRSQAQASLIKEGPYWLALTHVTNGSLGLTTGRTPADLAGNETVYQGDFGPSAPALAALNGAIYALWTGASGTSLNIARISEVPAFGNSFVKLRPDLSIADWFTVWNTDILNTADVDLGSAGPMLLPGTDLVTGGGKEGKLYLLKRNNLSGFCPPAKCGNAAGDTQVFQWFQATTPPCFAKDCGPLTPAATFHHIHGSPVYWDGPGGPFMYIWGEADYLRRFKFENGRLVTTPVASEITTPGRSMPGAMLSLSANGSDRTTGIIWSSHPTKGDASENSVRGTLHAMDASTLKELWNSDQDSADSLGYVSKFAPVTVANGKVYAATFSDPAVQNCNADVCKAKLVVYGLK